MAEITLKGLSFRYPGSTEDTLNDLNLEVASGEAHALLGGSGSGKSTLLNLLSGLLASGRGEISFDGRNVEGISPVDRAVTQVFQFPVLYEAMTVAENLAFPLKMLGERLAAQRLRVAELSRRLGIEALLPRPSRTLSLVEKQRVAIGKSLIRPDVSLVLLDEPLTAAEPGFKWQLRQTLKSIQKEIGATMIYVTHDQTEALTFADRISVLHEGRILQTDTAQALVERPQHEHVGFFVGTPGMNFLEGRVSRGHCYLGEVRLRGVAAEEGSCRIGFRPEWAEVSNDNLATGLPVEVLSTRTLGAERGETLGLVRVRIGGDTVVTRQSLAGVSRGPGWLSIDASRAVGFREGRSIVDA